MRGLQSERMMTHVLMLWHELRMNIMWLRDISGDIWT